MAKALTSGVEDAVTLATTVTRLTRTAYDTWRTLTILRLTSGSATIAYLDTSGTADGGALPSTGRIPISLSALPASFDIQRYGPINLAADAAGVIEVVIS